MENCITIEMLLRMLSSLPQNIVVNFAEIRFDGGTSMVINGCMQTNNAVPEIN